MEHRAENHLLAPAPRLGAGWFGLGDNRQMADDEKKAERHFNWQVLKEAVERMKPELGAASEATHKHGADDTPNDSDLDRTVALGYLVESLEGLCGPHLWVLNEISSALCEMHAADGEEGEETPRLDLGS